jgi:hypothetical protein
MLVLSSSGDSASQYMNYMNAFFTAQVTISLFAFAELKDYLLFWIDASVHIVLVLKAGVSSGPSPLDNIFMKLGRKQIVHYSFSMSC